MVFALPIFSQRARVLVPINIPGEVPGAFGSRFTTELVVHNGSNRYIKVDTFYGCAITCPRPPVDPFTTHEIKLSTPVEGGGAFLFVDSPLDNSIAFNLRVKDLSRQAQTWGTEIPVVPAADTFTTALDLVNVPIDARFRQTLRIYDFDGFSHHKVRLRIYPLTGSTPLIDRELVLSEGRNGGAMLDVMYPGYVQINFLAEAFPQIREHDRVRIRIESASSQLRFWAFVSITNNETQHITLITPQQF